ncbi:hypothetical protein C8Q79DRAFT_930289 [Trametes meyenii]|nr:hypothetical protein C8Q79DRAFT_930289 [Trametes meyenii]
MFTINPASTVALLLGVAASVYPVTAIVRPRMPSTFLGVSYSYPISSSLVNGTIDLAVRANGCPTGWAPCSATTCYPLDGSECCSDGNFCPAGNVCQSGGCCPFGEICDGSAGPPITIGGDPTTTIDTFVPDPTPTPPARTTTVETAATTTRAVTTIRTGPETHTTGSPTTATQVVTSTSTDTETIFHTSFGTQSTTHTTGTALAGTDGSDSLPTNPPAVGNVNGVTPPTTRRGVQWACAVLSALTASIFMTIPEVSVVYQYDGTPTFVSNLQVLAGPMSFKRS